MGDMRFAIVLLALVQSTASADPPTRQMIAGAIDHTFLKTGEHGVTLAQQRAAVAQLVNDAHRHGAYSVCVREHMVGHARKLLNELNSPVKLTSVIGFPSGDQFSTDQKLGLVRQARQYGADEYDMVLRYEDFKQGDHQRAYDDVRQVSREVGPQVLKVIFETAYLDDQQKQAAYELVAKAFTDAAGSDADVLGRRFLKTSTGFASPTDGAPVGATLADVEKMHAVSRGRFGIKPAGGVSAYEDALKFFAAAGAPYSADGKSIDPMKFRIGSSSLLLKLFAEEPVGKDY